MPIYLDHTATTRPSEAVVACLAERLAEQYANPASIHQAGREADRCLQSALKKLSATIGCNPTELVLTSGGTESINLALKGILQRRVHQPQRLIISQGEHAAVRETAAYLEKMGVAVEKLPLTAAGTVSLDAYMDALQQPAALISLIHVSNETGAMNPLEDLVALRNRYQPRTPIHLDAVQTWGKIPFVFNGSGVDLVSGSGHKLGAPKGIGWLVRKPQIRLEPLLHGGGQQAGQRSGTENPVFAEALSLALQERVRELKDNSDLVGCLRARFLKGIKHSGIPHQILSPAEGAPHILSIAFPGLRGETLVNALSAEHIYISSGAACSSRRSKGNTVLLAMGVSADVMRCAVRISFAAENSTVEIDETVETLVRSYKHLAHPVKDRTMK